MRLSINLASRGLLSSGSLTSLNRASFSLLRSGEDIDQHPVYFQRVPAKIEFKDAKLCKLRKLRNIVP